MMRAITPPGSRPASRRPLHRLEHVMRLVGCQAGIEDGEVDLLLFRKVDPDEGREAIEHATQGLLLRRRPGLSHPGATEAIPAPR